MQDRLQQDPANVSTSTKAIAVAPKLGYLWVGVHTTSVLVIAVQQCHCAVVHPGLTELQGQLSSLTNNAGF